MQVSKTENFIDSLKIRTSLDPGFRRDDDFEINSSSNVVVAQVGILQKLSHPKLSSLACDDRCVGGSHATRIPHSLPAKGVAGFQTAGGLPAKRHWLTSQCVPCKGGQCLFLSK